MCKEKKKEETVWQGGGQAELYGHRKNDLPMVLSRAPEMGCLAT